MELKVLEKGEKGVFDVGKSFVKGVVFSHLPFSRERIGNQQSGQAILCNEIAKGINHKVIYSLTPLFETCAAFSTSALESASGALVFLAS